MKKCLLIVPALLLCGSQLFAFDIAGIARGNWESFDSPLLDGIVAFSSMSGAFMSIARILATLLGTVCILWNVFRLWMGTTQVRNACVDIIVKFITFTALINVYPYAMSGTMDVAIRIGANAGGGITDITSSYIEMYRQSQAAVAAAQASAKELLNNKGNPDSVTQDAIDSLAETNRLPPEQIEDIARQAGYEVVATEAVADMNRRRLAQSDKTFKKTFKKAFTGKTKDAIVTLQAMKEVFNVNEGDDAKQAIENYMYDPFIKGTSLLSPGGMMKSAALIASFIAKRNSSDYNEGEHISGDDGSESLTPAEGTVKRGFVGNAIAGLINAVLLCLMTFGIIASAAFFIVQYSICVLEYAIVTAVGCLFIPFCLWDGTKSFAAKLVTLFTAYFIKIMVMVLCVFWVFGAYLKMGQMFMASTTDITLLDFSYFIFTALLGWVLTQNAPQIAVSILNGSPQLSMGEFVQAAGTAVAAGIGAKKAAEGGMKVVQGVGNAASTTAAAFARAGEAKNGVEFVGSLAKTIGTGVKNSAAQMLTGRDTASRKEGFGSKATGDDGKPITFEEQMYRAKGGEPGQFRNRQAAKDGNRRPAEDAKLEIGGGGEPTQGKE